MNQPNKPCECGSGRKQKKCHPFGAPLIGPAPEPRKNDPPVVRGRDDSLMLMMLPMLIMGGMRRMR